jgi:hypothetical protein
MSMGSIIILAGIIFGFGLFAATLMWGDLYTRDARR